MVRFQRFYDDGGGYAYRVIERIGEDPIANQDPTALATLAQELEAGAKSGYSGTDPAQAFVEPEHLSYPLAMERIAQLFDSPNAPDIVISPKSYAFGRQPGQHGALDVVQSRAPLVLSGPGVRPGVTDAVCAQVDVAPTLALLLGLPLIDGMDSSGRTSSERGVAPDVYLKRQDGRPIEEILDRDGEGELRRTPERVYIMLMDGISNTELQERLEKDAESIPNLRRLVEGGVMFRYGTTVNFPTITWPSHNALGSGAWCGHHDIVNPAYYLRETRQTVAPQGMQFDTAKFLSDGVETLYEAVHRAFGKWDGRAGALTASINEPCTRGAVHASLERRLVGGAERIRELSHARYEDTSTRWREDGQEGVYRYSRIDTQGLAQALMLFGDEDHPPPKFTYQEFALTDAVGHDYGPHADAIRTALDGDRQADRRDPLADGAARPSGLDAVRGHGRPRDGADRHVAGGEPGAGGAGRRPKGRRPGPAGVPAGHGRHAGARDGRPHRHRHRAGERRRRPRREAGGGGRRGARARRAADRLAERGCWPRRRRTASAWPGCPCPWTPTRRSSSSPSTTSGSTRGTCGWTARTSSRTCGSGCTGARRTN